MKIKIDRADKLFSEYIRKRDKYICQRCRKYYPEGKGLQVSHYYGRRYENIRFDDSNVISLCFNCHRYFHENPDEHQRFIENLLGKNEYDKLRLRASIIKKKDRKMALITVKLMIGDLEKQRSLEEKNEG